MLVLQIINAIAALTTVIAACIGLFRPSMFSGSKAADLGEVFYSRMYASRAIPLGVLTGVVPFVSMDDVIVTKMVLLAASLVQLCDVAMGFSKKEWGMLGGAMVAAVVHGLVAWAL